MAEIEILEDLEHIRLRPGMYIGSTYSPDHLTQEVLDNSLDEMVNGYASKIEIEANKEHIVITDNGRGIPFEQIEYNGKTYDSIFAICSLLKSGGKFSNSVYKHSIGLHGIGLTAVNALSKSLVVTTKDRINPRLYYNYEFNSGNLVSRESSVLSSIPNWSTRIEFQPDPKYFTIGEVNLSKIMQRLSLVHAKYPKSSIIINDEPIDKLSVADFARQYLNLNIDINLLETHSIFNTQHHISVYLTYDVEGNSQPVTLGDTNLHLCGGRYLQNFLLLWSKAVSEKFSIDKKDAISFLRAYVSILIPELTFDSQSKANMTKDISYLTETLNFTKILNNPFISESIQKIIDIKTNKRVQKKFTKKQKRVDGDNPLKDCINSPGKVLYILEGESAEGTLSQVRDKRNEAVLPISGKILNVAKKSIEEALDSKKFRFLTEAIGIENINKKQYKYRYDTFKILADADKDGCHISVLIAMAFWKYAPDIIKNGKLVVILPPLYGAIDKKNNFIPLYDETQIAFYSNQGYNIIRFKGLGEMSPKQLEVIIRNPREYVPKAPLSKIEAESIFACLTSVELKRKLCKDVENFNLQKLVDLTKKEI